MEKYFYVVYSLYREITNERGVGCTTIISRAEEVGVEPEFLIKDAVNVIQKSLPRGDKVLILSWKEISKLQKDEYDGVISSSNSSNNP